MKHDFKPALPWVLAVATAIGLTGRTAMAAQTPPVPGTTLAKDGRTYTARHVLVSSLPTTDLLAICFDFKHLQAFCPGIRIKLLKSTPDSQTLEYRNDYQVWTSSATYQKTIDRAQHTVRFTLLNHQVSGWGMPVMTASCGSYTIRSTPQARTLTYAQSVTLNHEIGSPEWALIQQKTRTFFANFEAYIRQQETLEAKHAAPGKTASPQ
jgi:hypothetical protein